MTTTLSCEPIGIVHTPFRERAEAPRQPAAARTVAGRIELYSGRNFEHALVDISSWRYLWVLFWFHLNEGWRPKVQPPRSARRRGVFATRSPHRPNPIGMSVLLLERVDGLNLHVLGVDMLDQTPVLDLKPYVTYTDAVVDDGGWLAEHDPKAPFLVEFTPEAQRALTFLRDAWGVDLEGMVQQTLQLGPEPHPYRRIKALGDGFVLAVKEWRAHFEVREKTVIVRRIQSGFRPSALLDEAKTALDVHRAFVARDFA
jgi:tRNA-Thr(GGU) m(6)t(6)A37 methyltransferase TsaA